MISFDDIPSDGERQRGPDGRPIRRLQQVTFYFYDVIIYTFLMLALPKYVTQLPFLQYSPITESCNQLALGVFQISKALFCQDLSKYTPSNSHAKLIPLTSSFTFLYVRKYNTYQHSFIS